MTLTDLTQGLEEVLLTKVKTKFCSQGRVWFDGMPSSDLCHHVVQILCWELRPVEAISGEGLRQEPGTPYSSPCG